MDFSLNKYKELLNSFIAQNYYFLSFERYLESGNSSRITHHLSLILRHDVDRKPENALKMAQMEHELGIKAGYYFRIVKESNHPEIIKEIVRLGHEIGYHYEDLALANGDYEKAIQSFERNLEYFRQFYPVKTICMHGSPTSEWDSKKLWDKYNYRDFGIIGEPYFDIDFSEVAYYTDTGRRWNGERFSIRDKVNTREYGVGSRGYGVRSKEGKKFTRDELDVTGGQWPRFRKTNEIIRAIEEGRFPRKAMITVHPQRWTDDPVLWGKELVWQNFKNIVKYLIVRRNSLGGGDV